MIPGLDPVIPDPLISPRPGQSGHPSDTISLCDSVIVVTEVLTVNQCR